MAQPGRKKICRYFSFITTLRFGQQLTSYFTVTQFCQEYLTTKLDIVQLTMATYCYILVSRITLQPKNYFCKMVNSFSPWEIWPWGSSVLMLYEWNFDRWLDYKSIKKDNETSLRKKKKTDLYIIYHNIVEVLVLLLANSSLRCKGWI